MKPLRSFALLSIVTLALAACGGAGSGESSDDPTQLAPVVYITNGATFTTLTQVWAYEAFTGELRSFTTELEPGETSKAVPGLIASQYDFYVYFSDGHRSDAATTLTNDPYNGQAITRQLPRVNPGEIAEVQFGY